jgi:hypothetical protein
MNKMKKKFRVLWKGKITSIKKGDFKKLMKIQIAMVYGKAVDKSIKI